MKNLLGHPVNFLKYSLRLSLGHYFESFTENAFRNAYVSRNAYVNRNVNNIEHELHFYSEEEG